MGARAAEGWLAGAFPSPRLGEAPASAAALALTVLQAGTTLDQVVKCSMRRERGEGTFKPGQMLKRERS